MASVVKGFLATLLSLTSTLREFNSREIPVEYIFIFSVNGLISYGY